MFQKLIRDKEWTLFCQNIGDSERKYCKIDLFLVQSILFAIVFLYLKN